MAMTTIPSEDLAAPTASGTRSERLAIERKMLDEARKELTAGHGIGDDDLDAWLDALVAGEPLDLPDSTRTARPR